MERAWIGVVRARCVKTVIVRANSRKEAEAKLRGGMGFEKDIEGIDVHYTQTGPGKILREEK